MTKIRYRVLVWHDGAIEASQNYLELKAVDIDTALAMVRERHGHLPGFRIVQVFEQ